MMGELSTQRWDYLYSYLLHLSHILEFFIFGLYASLGCRRLPFFQRLLGVGCQLQPITNQQNTTS